MLPKGKPLTTPSDAVSKEKLAQYVYEYLVHVGAQKAAAQFLTEIRWEKQIPLSEAPGFLLQWWCVFFDLYSASPERSEGAEYTNEAKAFHEYGGMSLHGPPLPSGMAPVGPGGPRENGMMPMPGGAHPGAFFPGPGMMMMPRLPPGSRFPPPPHLAGMPPHPFAARGGPGGYPLNGSGPPPPYGMPSGYPGPPMMYAGGPGGDRFPPPMMGPPPGVMGGPLAPPQGHPMNGMMNSPPMEAIGGGCPPGMDPTGMGGGPGPSPRMNLSAQQHPMSNCSTGPINGEDGRGGGTPSLPLQPGGDMGGGVMGPPGGMLMNQYLPPGHPAMLPPNSSPSLRPEGGGEEWAQHRSPRNECRTSYMYSPSNLTTMPKHGMVD